MTDIQREILKLILEIDSICRKYGIEYYLEGGSALGAIRHGGFLPWDDDADLAMTRENWNKFKHAVEEEKIPERVLESAELNDAYPTMSNRYINTATTNLWRSLMLDICAGGVGIDIFVLEAAPDDDAQLEQMKRDLIDYCEYVNRFYRISSLGDSTRYKELRKLEKIIGRSAVADNLNQKIIQYEESTCNRYLMRWAFRFQIYEKSIFGKPRYVPFEKDYFLPVPDRIYEYLDYQYGPDWYMIPETDNVDVHDTVLDLKVGYRKYVDQYMAIIDRDEALRVNQEYKDLEMEAMEYNKKYHQYLYSTAGKAEAYLTNKACLTYSEDLNAVFDRITYDNNLRFQTLFGNYLTKQLNQWYLFYQIFVPLEDRYLAVVIKYLIKSGEIKKAKKILDIRLKQSNPPSDDILQSEQDVRANGKILALFWEDQEEDATCRCQTIGPAQEAARICFKLIHCVPSQTQSYSIAIQKGCEVHPNEDLFKLAKLLLRMRVEGGEACIEDKNKLWEETQNGMLRMWLDHHECLFC